MAGYIELAETVLYKNGRTTIINTYNELSTIAMPAQFRFDMAVMCGPKWSAGEHKLAIKVKANEKGEELKLVETTIKIPHEQFVYHAIANDVKFNMDYSVQYLTFTVFDNDTEVISRVYPVRAMLIPKKVEQQEEAKENKKDKKKKQ